MFTIIGGVPQQRERVTVTAVLTLLLVVGSTFFLDTPIALFVRGV